MDTSSLTGIYDACVSKAIRLFVGDLSRPILISNKWIIIQFLAHKSYEMAHALDLSALKWMMGRLYFVRFGYSHH